MAVYKYLARDIAVEVQIDSTYTSVGGLETLAHAPAKTDADATDFDSAGREEHVTVQRGDSWTLSGFYLEDVESGEGDPGQQAIIALSKAIGLADKGQFRLTSPGGNSIAFQASVDVTGPAGEKNALASFQAVLKVSGQITYGAPASS